MTDESPNAGTRHEYGPDHSLHPDDAEKIVRVVARIREVQPSPEHAPVECWDCGLAGYATPCHSIPMEEATPTAWTTVFVCRDCADRDDPLCGVEPSDLDHPEVRTAHRLDEVGPYEDPDLTEMNFECPSCGFPIAEWTDCPDCGWYDEAVWEETMAHYSECRQCGQTIGGGSICDACDTVEVGQ